MPAEVLVTALWVLGMRAANGTKLGRTLENLAGHAFTCRALTRAKLINSAVQGGRGQRVQA